MSKLKQLSELGQSVWLDYIRRSFIKEGDLQALIDEGLRGITSNPSIFEKAIAGSADYDDDLGALVEQEKSVDEIYEALVLADISAAADLLRPVYDETDGVDGYVSLEVDPTLANDTDGTIAEAKRLFSALNKPNVMIKVPATDAGIPAITELIGSGLNINVTLIFDLDNYKAVADAYIAGLEKLSEQGGDVSKIASVASFFVSRVDSAVDEALEKKGNTALQGKIAIANSKIAYAMSHEIFSGSRWQNLADAGARIQRLLWASTSTKNDAYPETLYVDELIGAGTVNTLPPATLTAFKKQGTVAETLQQNVGEAKEQFVQLRKVGVDLDEITRELQEDGVAKFADSFKSLKESISEKRDRLRQGAEGYRASLGVHQEKVDKALDDLRDNDIMRRIWEHDHTVWQRDPTEISNRLGWLQTPETMPENIAKIETFVQEVRDAGFTNALLLGMGGSSLAPEMFRMVFGVKEGYLELSVLDSTDTAAVQSYDEQLDPAKTLFIVSTKSGGTVETLSFFKYFYNRTIDAVGAQRAGEHFIAITDPGSALEKMAAELNFRRKFLNNPEIGGRYSALSFFGLVPAALVGVELDKLLERAATMACNCEGCNCPVAGDNSGAWLGAVMGTLATAGRDKLTLVSSPAIAPFGAWVEQLIAESTGKNGKGILPVDGEKLASADEYTNDRLFVYLRLDGDSTHDASVEALQEAGHPVVQLNLDDTYDLGGEFFRWEIATAVAGYFLGINPFDQPNVESAKVLARKMVDEFHETGELPRPNPTFTTDILEVYTDFKADDLDTALNELFERREDGAYVALQAYLTPDEKTDAALQELRHKIRGRFNLATTLGYGPRFLHSTGQLHKGDAGKGLFLQFTADSSSDAEIPDKAGEPGSSMTFGTLIMAQALGDRQALLDADRAVIRFHFKGDSVKGLKEILSSLS